jgi:hypothetical protein
MTKLNTTAAARKSNKGVSLSKGTKKFEAIMEMVEMAQEIITHTPEVVTSFSETTGVQIMMKAPSTALTLIPGMGVVDLTKSTRQATKAQEAMVTLTLPAGSKVQKGYIYTPEIEGKTRWFDCRLVKWSEVDGSIKVEASKKAVKARGLLHLIQA